jgi:hypothetical protein
VVELVEDQRSPRTCRLICRLIGTTSGMLWPERVAVATISGEVVPINFREVVPIIEVGGQAP